MEITLESATDDPIELEIFDRTPQSIICIGDAVVPQPYYFDDDEADKERVIASCFVPTEMLTGATSVLFKIPFMGTNWAPTAALPDDTVTLARIGGGTLIIISAMPFSEPLPGEPTWLAVLDQDYRLGASDAFIRLTENQLKLNVSDDIVSQYQKLYLSRGSTSYLLDLPRAAPAAASASLENSQEPPVVKKVAAAIIDFKGAKLSEVTAVKLGRTKLPYEAYADGSRLRVFLREGETERTGKFDLSLSTADDALEASFYVLDDPPKPAAPAAT
jgi:hypothetical protein